MKVAACNKHTILKNQCKHKIEDQITTDDHEICCRKCGMIIDTDNTIEVRVESTANLFQEVQPGCKPVKLEFSRIHEPKFASSAFSNACDKLNLPKHVSLDAYRIFIKIFKTNKFQKQMLQQKLKYLQQELENKSVNNHRLILKKMCETKKEVQILTNCEIAIYSLFVAIRRFGILSSPNEISNAVKFSFSVKHAPHIFKVFSDVKPIANKLGINYDNEDHLEYWINIHLRKSQNELNFLTNEIKNQVRRISKTIHGTDEVKARLAVKIVIAGLKIKNG